MSVVASQPESTKFRKHKAWRALLLLAFTAVAGCSKAVLPNDSIPSSGADPSYSKFVAAYVKRSFTNLSPNDPIEISEPRWMQSYTFWSWIACVHFPDRGHRRTYVVYFKGSEVIDGRYAVRTDACETQIYTPLDPTSGALLPGAAGDPGPLY